MTVVTALRYLEPSQALYRSPYHSFSHAVLNHLDAQCEFDSSKDMSSRIESSVLHHLCYIDSLFVDTLGYSLQTAVSVRTSVPRYTVDSFGKS